jgi:drug/metabolite transporter (DMT)-like permease
VPFLPLVLVVLAAFIHASWNLIAKRAAAAGTTFVFFYNLAACIVYLPWVMWLLAYREQMWSLPVIGCIFLSTIIHLAYSLCLQRGYQVADLSVVYPVARGTGPMLSSLGAFAVLGETPSLHGTFGLLAVVAGIGLLTTQGDLSAFRRAKGQEGARWGLTTGSLIASYTVVDGYGVKMLGIQPVMLDWLSNLLRFFMLLPHVLSHRSRTMELMKGRWHLAVGVGILSSLSYILVLTALELGAPLSLVAPAREMSMMVGAIFGMIILRESVNMWRIAGCLVLFFGVLLLSAP